MVTPTPSKHIKEVSMKALMSSTPGGPETLELKDIPIPELQKGVVSDQCEQISGMA